MSGIIVGNKGLKKIMVGSKVIWDSLDGWQELELGESIAGIMLGRINKTNNTIDLLGVISVPAQTTSVIIKSDSKFDFNLSKTVGVTGSQNGFNGANWSNSFSSQDGNLFLGTQSSLLAYRISEDYKPLKLPILIK